MQFPFITRGGSSFFPKGGGFDPTTMRSIVHEPRSGEPIFFVLFWNVFLASTNGMMAFFYAHAMSEPRSGEPIFLGLFWTPVSDVFLASTNHMMAFFYAHITCSLGSPKGGGGGGFKPYDPPLITYGIFGLWHYYINGRMLTKQANIEKIYVYMRASLEIFAFHIKKLLFLSIFCWYFRNFVGTNDIGLLVGLHVPTDFQIYRQNSEKALWGSLGGGAPLPPPPPPPPSGYASGPPWLFVATMTRNGVWPQWTRFPGHGWPVFFYIYFFRAMMMMMMMMMMIDEMIMPMIYHYNPKIGGGGGEDIIMILYPPWKFVGSPPPPPPTPMSSTPGSQYRGLIFRPGSYIPLKKSSSNSL